jgi:transcriptional regulator with XRE-family HTH domain
VKDLPPFFLTNILLFLNTIIFVSLKNKFNYLCLVQKNTMKIGNKLKGLRVEKGLSPIEIAKVLNISESTYRKYEANKSFPDVFTLDKLAKLYNKNFSDLLPEEITVINSNNGEYSNNAAYIIHQHLSEKLIDQYEARIKDLLERIQYLERKIIEAKL